MTSPGLIEALRSTLQQLEQKVELSPNDPALCELKRLILRAIAELEMRKAAAA